MDGRAKLTTFMFVLCFIQLHKFQELLVLSKHPLTLFQVKMVIGKTNQGSSQATVARLGEDKVFIHKQLKVVNEKK